jgi:hypothetical protein
MSSPECHVDALRHQHSYTARPGLRPRRRHPCTPPAPAVPLWWLKRLKALDALRHRCSQLHLSAMGGACAARHTAAAAFSLRRSSKVSPRMQHFSVRSTVPWPTSWMVAHRAGCQAWNLASFMAHQLKGALVSCQSQSMSTHAMPSGCVAH